MSSTASRERILRFRVRAETIVGKPVVAFGVAKPGGPGAHAFIFAGDVQQIERFAAELMCAAGDARLMALMESRRKPRPANRGAVR